MGGTAATVPAVHRVGRDVAERPDARAVSAAAREVTGPGVGRADQRGVPPDREARTAIKGVVPRVGAVGMPAVVQRTVEGRVVLPVGRAAIRGRHLRRPEAEVGAAPGSRGPRTRPTVRDRGDPEVGLAVPVVTAPMVRVGRVTCVVPVPAPAGGVEVAMPLLPVEVVAASVAAGHARRASTPLRATRTVAARTDHGPKG